MPDMMKFVIGKGLRGSNIFFCPNRNINGREAHNNNIVYDI